MQAVTEKGLGIPEDIAFVSFDKISNQEIFNLPFSYLERNIQDLGEQAARLLVRRFNDPDGPQQRVVVMSKVALLGSGKEDRIIFFLLRCGTGTIKLIGQT